MREGPPRIVGLAGAGPELAAACRSALRDIASVRERGWGARPDRDILAAATGERRFVLTHDSDFGTLAIQQGRPSGASSTCGPVVVHPRPSSTTSRATKGAGSMAISGPRRRMRVLSTMRLPPASTALLTRLSATCRNRVGSPHTQGPVAGRLDSKVSTLGLEGSSEFLH